MRKSVFFTYLKILIVIGIIAVVIYYGAKYFFKEYDKVTYETVKTDMLLIQAQTELISQMVEIEEDDVEYIGTEIEEKKDDEKVKYLIDNDIIDIESDDSEYYCLDKDDLVELGLEDVNTEEYYIVDYKKNDVVYIDGIENEEGEIVYKLSDMDIEIQTETDEDDDSEEKSDSKNETE